MVVLLHWKIPATLEFSKGPDMHLQDMRWLCWQESRSTQKVQKVFIDLSGKTNKQRREERINVFFVHTIILFFFIPIHFIESALNIQFFCLDVKEPSGLDLFDRC